MNVICEIFRRTPYIADMKPGGPAYQYTLAVARVGRRQYEAAQALLEPLVAKRPADAQLQYALGSLLYMQGHLPEAEARLRESLRLDPNQVASPYYLALAARDQGRDSEAVEQLENLLRRTGPTATKRAMPTSGQALPRLCHTTMPARSMPRPSRRSLRSCPAAIPSASRRSRATAAPKSN